MKNIKIIFLFFNRKESVHRFIAIAILTSFMVLLSTISPLAPLAISNAYAEEAAEEKLSIEEEEIVEDIPLDSEDQTDKNHPRNFRTNLKSPPPRLRPA